MAKRTTTTASPNPSNDAAEAAHGHHHHHHHLFQHLHHHKAKPAPPPVAAADRFQCNSDDINDCADAFIKHFRQQLELQRMQSIENYHQMLARGL